jgi:hypothetical protein
MEPQDRLQDSLDALLSSQPSARWSLPTSQREELEPMLDLADDLALVRNVLPAPAFADDLEARLVARARRHATGAVSVLEEGDAADVGYAPTIPALEIPGSHSRGTSRPSRGSRRVSWRVWTSLAAVVLLALTITIFTVAANASPGSALYGVRRWQEDARTNLAMSDADRAKLHIQYATDALDALDAAVAQHASTNMYDEAMRRWAASPTNCVRRMMRWRWFQPEAITTLSAQVSRICARAGDVTCGRRCHLWTGPGASQRRARWEISASRC